MLFVPTFDTKVTNICAPIWDNYRVGYYRVGGDFVRLRNCSKLVEGSLFVIIDLLRGAKTITLYFMWS